MSEANQLAVKVEKVSKHFRLPHERHSSVKSLIVNPWSMKRRYEVQHALRGVDFEIKKGEFFGIVGRNGSGKSTLLKILAGIYQPSKGRVQVSGRLVPFIELGVGFNPELTGRENVYLNGALLGFSKKQIDAQYDDIVKFSELERFMDQKLKNYSSGMQVRLAFSVAIMSDADVLLVDEVLAVGDADFQRKCFNYFENLKKNKKTVVFVSHDMEAVREFCDRAVLIDKSRVVAKGSADEVATQYTRLFTEDLMQEEDGEDEAKKNKRWGDGLIKINKVSVTPKRITEKEDHISITIEATAMDAISSPVVGVLIKHPTGDHILGTNTKVKKVKLGDFKGGEKFQVSWQVPNIFSNGVHSVDVAAQHQDGITTCDWWEDAAEFKVLRDENTHFIVSPNLKVDITKKD